MNLWYTKIFLKYFLFIIFICGANTVMASNNTRDFLSTLFNLKGKTAIITGASQRLGKQFAITLNKAGARVILASRNIKKLNDISKELGNSLAVQMDVTNAKSIKEAFTRLENNSEKIDICINNAAIGALTPIFSEDANNDFEQTIQTNLIGTWHVTREVANHMKRNKIHGSIINIGSINGDSFPYKELSPYASSKAAVMHITKSLVNELSQYK